MLKYTIIIIFLLSSYTSLSQTFEYKYKLKHLKGKSSTYFSLYSNGQRGNFSVDQEAVEIPGDETITWYMPELKYSVYFTVDSTIYNQQKFGYNIFAVQENGESSQEWEIIGPSESIAGYETIKAKKYVGKILNTPVYDLIWFAPEIPIRMGPGQQFDVPGLVVKYRSTDMYVYELVNVTKTDTALMPTPVVENNANYEHIIKNSYSRKEFKKFNQKKQ